MNTGCTERTKCQKGGTGSVKVHDQPSERRLVRFVKDEQEHLDSIKNRI